MIETRTFTIPEEFYTDAPPRVTAYLSRATHGLLYREGRERAWALVGVVSPYVLGWDAYRAGWTPDRCTVLDVNVAARTVTIQRNGASIAQPS